MFSHRVRLSPMIRWFAELSLLILLLVSWASFQWAQRDPSIKTTTTNSWQTLNEFRANKALRLVRDWASKFGNDIHYGTQEVSCMRSMRDHYDPAKTDHKRAHYKASVVSIDWTRTHDEIVKTISNTMGWHKSAVESIAKASEELAGNHTFDPKLRFNYIDVHRLHNIDEEDPIEPLPDSFGGQTGLDSGAPNSDEPSENQDGVQPDQNAQQPNGEGEPPPEPLPRPLNLQKTPEAATNDSALDPMNSSDFQVEWQTPIKYLKLSEHKNFDVLINAEESAVHVPVHIFHGEPQVMNGIAWSEQLNKVFRDNFARNPKLTNQYFASQSGFMRLFPAQKWQIARTDPDLYDARMRPWYVAGASSRKDVIILVDSSGSMTGSRRDIAKGVVFEILDTLTDNDHFLVLKFSDSVQQVGLPSCSKLRVHGRRHGIPLKNTLFQESRREEEHESDIESLFLTPATGRNIRQVKNNFTIPTSGIANFSKALITAFEVLNKYQENESLGSQCNQAIMLITDGSPSDFEDIFNRYNYPNAPVRVFTYLIGREASDIGHTKMMACHNRGYYTHVINLAEVRETVQQYIPVLARPLVLNGTHPITWTPAYGELTYQILTDWIWESKRRERARAILAANGRGSSLNAGYLADVRVTDDDGSMYPEVERNPELLINLGVEESDLFGYENNTECFWQTTRNDLLTTVVQPVYDRKRESVVTEKYLLKNVWTIKETVMRTAQIFGVAAADMKINDIIALAPSYKLGPNGYAIMLTNNGYAMHHPDLRSILEPLSTDPSERNLRILKPFFASIDFTQVEHILNSSTDNNLLILRQDAVSGLTGWRELLTKRTFDCQKRVQIRKQSFYYKPLQHFPFSFIIAIPQPYGSHRVEAQIEIKNSPLPEKVSNYFTQSELDLWTVHPDYQYCDGPSNDTITTLLDMLHRVEEKKFDDIQWRPAESSKPPIFLPSKIVCNKELIQSLVYDAVATYSFSDSCEIPSPSADPLSILLALLPRSVLLNMYGVRFSFVATRSGLTRARRYNSNDIGIEIEIRAFLKKHARAVDETFYSRTVDYNMLVDENATLIQVPFNTHEKIRNQLYKYEMQQLQSYQSPLIEPLSFTDSSASSENPSRLSVKDMSLLEQLEILTLNSSIHMIASQSIIASEGTQRAVAGVSGVFYNYATFVLNFFNSTNSQAQDGRPMNKLAACYTSASDDESCNESRAPIKCGLSNDTIDCLLVDNNGYIVVSEDLDYTGRHLKSYDHVLMERLVSVGLFNEINVTDYQSICVKHEEKQTSSSGRSIFLRSRAWSLVTNALESLAYSWSILVTLSGLLSEKILAQPTSARQQQQQQQQQDRQPMLALLPNKTYLRPCERTLTLYESRLGLAASESAEFYTSRCGCDAWFVFERVPKTNLLMLIVDSSRACRLGCDVASFGGAGKAELVHVKHGNRTNEQQVCSMLERESQLYRRRLDDCYSHHPDEEQIKLCGAATKSARVCAFTLLVMILISTKLLHQSARATPLGL